MTTRDGIPVPPITWRDAVTPRSRASRRRWTACYPLLLVLLAAVVVDQRLNPRGPGVGGDIPLVLIVAPAVVFGMLRRGTRRLTASDHPALDERDIAARNAAYRIAFPLLVVVTLAGIVVLGYSLPSITQWTQVAPHERSGERGWFLTSQALLALAAWIAVWGAFLPTGALAWREPDAPDPEPGTPLVSETLRDALLGIALAGAIAEALLVGSDWGVLAIAATLALLGALGRRSLGQPIISRATLVAFALAALAFGIFVYGVRASSSGGASDPHRATPVPAHQR